MVWFSKKRKEINSFIAKNEISNKTFELEEAINLIKQYESTSVLKSKKSNDWSIDINFHVNVEPGKSVNSSVILPNGNGKKHKIIAFVDEADIATAKKLGASEAGLDSLIDKILGGFTDFDKCVASQSVFTTVSKKLAKTLGPKGLLPSLKAGTVSNDLTSLITNAIGGQVAIKASKTGNVSASIGRVSFDNKKIIENIKTFSNSLKALKASGNKVFINSFYISTTMGFGVKVKEI